MISDKAVQNPIILFDGVCNLCCSSVRFIIKRDNKKIFRFASLQSDAATQLLKEFDFSQATPDSFILLQDGKLYTQSTAALKVAQQLNFPYRLMYLFIAVPPFIRNYIYSVVARHRYQWFGKQDTCWLPNEELNELFIK